MKKIIIYVLLTLIVIIGFNLRRFSYAEVPNPGDTSDEYSFGWLGLSLIKDGYPIAWSGTDPYVHDYQKINVDNLYVSDPERLPFPIDKPWFDHPPFFGLFVGGFAYLSGVRSFEDASVLILRRPMIILGTINIILIFILASLLSGKLSGLISSAIYSFTPLIAISSRLALAENGYIPIFLTAVTFALLYIKKKNMKFWYIACILSGLSLLFKLSALAIPISILIIVTFDKGKLDLKLIKPIAYSVFISVFLFFVYGAYFDINIFIKVLLMNTSRILGAGPEIFYQVISGPRIATLRYFSDGWSLVGWISFFAIMIVGWKKTLLSKVIFSCITSYFLVFLVFGGEPYGWYRFPFYPFLTIAIAKVFLDIYKSANLILGYMLFLLPFGAIVHRLLGLQEFQKYNFGFKVFSIFIFAVWVFSLINPKKGKVIIKVILSVLLISLFWLSYNLVYFYSVKNWLISS